MKKFKRIYIEITNVCNLSCHFCPQTKRKLELMDVETFDKVLDQIKPHTDFIYLHIKGEPLLHPKISELISLSGEKGFKVNITTNGTHLHHLMDHIIEKNVIRQINISLHSLSGNEMMNKVNYLKEVISFVKNVEKKTNIFISLRLWNIDQTETKKNQELLEIIEKEFNLDYSIEEKVSPNSSVKLSKQIFLNQDHQFQWPDLNAPEIGNKGFCYGLRDHCGILVDGTVIPCCLDGEGVINLGNIHLNHFSNIIESERANAIYEGFSNRNVIEELCRKCGYRTKIVKSES